MNTISPANTLDLQNIKSIISDLQLSIRLRYNAIIQEYRISHDRDEYGDPRKHNIFSQVCYAFERIINHDVRIFTFEKFTRLIFDTLANPDNTPTLLEQIAKFKAILPDLEKLSYHRELFILSENLQDKNFPVARDILLWEREKILRKMVAHWWSISEEHTEKAPV